MSIKTVRRVFISILIFLPLQYIVVGIVGYYYAEPWPAFVFPGFKNVYESNGQYQIHQTHFDLYNSRGEKLESVQPHNFFSGIPRSQVAGFLRVFFHDKNAIGNLSAEAKNFLHQTSLQFANRDVSRMDIVYEVDFVESATSDLEPDSVDRWPIETIDFTD